MFSAHHLAASTIFGSTPLKRLYVFASSYQDSAVGATIWTEVAFPMKAAAIRLFPKFIVFVFIFDYSQEAGLL